MLQIVVLLILALVAVPWILFPRPFILKKLPAEVEFDRENYAEIHTEVISQTSLDHLSQF